jgi:hypothetical protein
MDTKNFAAAVLPANENGSGEGSTEVGVSAPNT